MVRVTSLLIIAASALGFSFGVRDRSEMKNMVRCRHAMLKVVCKRSLNNIEPMSTAFRKLQVLPPEFRFFEAVIKEVQLHTHM